MIRYEDLCVGCPPERGCLGSSCPNKNAIIYECDECGHEPDKLYVYDGNQLCYNCFIKQFEMIDDDLFLVDGERVTYDELFRDYCEEVLE